jgi:hypothetical protein
MRTRTRFGMFTKTHCQPADEPDEDSQSANFANLSLNRKNVIGLTERTRITVNTQNTFC